MDSEKLNWWSRFNFFVSSFNFNVRVISATFFRKNYLKFVRIYNHFVIAKPINCCFTFWLRNCSNSLSLLAKLVKALSSALLSSKLWTEAFGIKKKSCWKKYYITLAQKLSLGVHLIWLCHTRFVRYIFEHNVYDLLNKNRCTKASHYLDHMLRVLRSISREICRQKL